MKTLEELGISPTPWRVLEWNGVSSQTCYTVESATHTVCDLNNDDDARSDASLISDAPELYECLREAVSEACKRCYSHEDGECRLRGDTCMVQRWRAALERAGGAE